MPRAGILSGAARSAARSRGSTPRRGDNVTLVQEALPAVRWLDARLRTMIGQVDRLCLNPPAAAPGLVAVRRSG
ncbi:hypothetical protein KZ820_14560 [Sphingomonas sp. RRHST34]|uniref:Uncharacterized protein n=1 Tax=Sphingomonas citri TaxID=2862499 RepID=A0ABS7BQS9_9SPHN|nr:hypothetical protein [Sphingomonas citri]MBW6531961.1 hypothetical protein [Sphingomonas citri]